MTTQLQAVRNLADIMPKHEALTGCVASLIDHETIEIKISFTGDQSRVVYYSSPIAFSCSSEFDDQAAAKMFLALLKHVTETQR
jgi:hypothetical protein